jgi:hypothetical protein
VSGPTRPGAIAHGRWQPATHDQLTGCLGLGLACRSSRGSGPRCGNGGCAPSALALQSPHVVHARDNTVAHSPAARCWLAGCKVLPVSSRGPQGGHRARRSGAELTRTAVQRGGGGEVSGQRHSSVGRELRWPVVMEARPCSVGVEGGR